MDKSIGELGGAIIVIVLLGLILLVGRGFFQEGGRGETWLNGLFHDNLEAPAADE